MPIVSIIVPVYKVENVLHYCIDSILNQTYKDFELILVDDGSPDNSGKICDEYAKKDNRITVIHKENGGVSSARNCGIDAAKGKYVCFVDSDDYVNKNYLEILIKTKSEHSEFDNIWCYFQTVTDYDSTGGNLIVDDNKNIYSVKDIMTLHEKWLDAGPVCKLYDRKIILENGLTFDSNLSLGEDLIFNFQYLDCTNGKIFVIPKKLYSYVQVSDCSLSQKYYPNMFEIYKTINSTMHRFIVKWNCSEEQVKKYFNACFYKYDVVLKNTFSEKNKASKNDKIRYNNSIMKSKEFVQSLNNLDCYINPAYKIAYRTKNCKLVLLLDKMLNKLNRRL